MRLPQKIQQDNAIFNPIEEAIHKNSKKPFQSKSFYPSEASCVVDKEIIGACLRKQYYRWIGMPPSEGTTYRTHLSAKLGDRCEEVFLDLYQQMGLLKGRALPFKCTVMGLNISGKLDGLTKEGEIIECKSAYGRAFAYSVCYSPKKDHLCQIILYMACMGIDSCIIPYLCRDDTAIRAGYRMSKKEIEATGITVIGILSRWKKLQQMLKDNITPEREFIRSAWQCRYCQYKTHCWKK